MTGTTVYSQNALVSNLTVTNITGTNASIDSLKVNSINMPTLPQNQSLMHPIVYDTTTKNLSYSMWSLVPPGVISQFAGIVAPSGYFICEGQEVSRTMYASLFSVIGTMYGAGNGSTTFNLPNFKGRVPVGFDSTQSEFNSINKLGGEKTHSISSDELPSHNHSGTVDSNGSHTHGITDPGHRHNFTTINDDYNNSGTNPPGFSADSAGLKTWYTSYENTGITVNSGGAHTHTFTTSSVGNNVAMNVMQPFIVVNYIIKY